MLLLILKCTLASESVNRKAMLKAASAVLGVDNLKVTLRNLINFRYSSTEVTTISTLWWNLAVVLAALAK